jgi:hypothetical protein
MVAEDCGRTAVVGVSQPHEQRPSDVTHLCRGRESMPYRPNRVIILFTPVRSLADRIGFPTKLLTPSKRTTPAQAVFKKSAGLGDDRPFANNINLPATLTRPAHPRLPAGAGGRGGRRKRRCPTARRFHRVRGYETHRGNTGMTWTDGYASMRPEGIPSGLRLGRETCQSQRPGRAMRHPTVPRGAHHAHNKKVR